MANTAQSERKTFLIDKDNVLADWDGALERVLREEFPEIRVVPPQQKKKFYLEENYPEEARPTIRGIYQAQFFYRDLPPFPGAVNALHTLLELGHEVRICTSLIPAYRYCVGEGFEWVERHLGSDWVNRIIIAKDKTLIRGDILVDDKASVTGAHQPNWEHVIFSHPSNLDVQGKRRLESWKDWRLVLLDESRK
jgi:5'-nucleotidase